MFCLGWHSLLCTPSHPRGMTGVWCFVIINIHVWFEKDLYLPAEGSREWSSVWCVSGLTFVDGDADRNQSDRMKLLVECDLLFKCRIARNVLIYCWSGIIQRHKGQMIELHNPKIDGHLRRGHLAGHCLTYELCWARGVVTGPSLVPKLLMKSLSFGNFSFFGQNM